jgi:diaminopimelate decarboxylase/aspartate kinase
MEDNPENPGKRPWLVLKFGGTSVSEAGLWREVATQAGSKLANGSNVMLVVSALQGVTNALQAFLEQPARAAAPELFDRVRDKHLDLLQALEMEPGERLVSLLEDLNRLLERPTGDWSDPALQACLLAMGEMLSSAVGEQVLLAAGLGAVWDDAGEFLVSEAVSTGSNRSHYLAARCAHLPSPELAAQLESRGSLHITQGFVARNQQNQTVVLGRGGSDTSAAYLAAILQAQQLEIWSDVPGLFSANPHRIPAARLLQNLSYREAQELASMGVRVLHPRCISPLREYEIPIYLRQTSRPDITGTVISSRARDFGAQVKAIVHHPGTTLISMEGLNMWHQVGFLADVFTIFKCHGLSLDLISTSESNVTVSLDLDAHLLDPHTLEEVLQELNLICRATLIPDCASVSLVGQGIRTILHRLGPALEVFEQRRIYLVSQAANDLNLTFVVDRSDAEKLVMQLHQQLIPGGVGGDSVFGVTWQQMFCAGPALQSASRPWWQLRREQLIETIGEVDAAYVYDAGTLRSRASQLQALSSLDRLFFAMKANPHPEILRLFIDQGLGVECVSPQEIARVLEVEPELPPERILFTPNFAARKEYRDALALGVQVTVDNIYVLEHWGSDFAGREILLRIDPGSGLGHHKMVRTAGENAKFGIPMADLDGLQQLLSQHQVTVIGLHAHTGSGIMHPDAWQRTLGNLGSLLDQFPDVRCIDIGGGLGIPDKQDELPMDLPALDESLKAVRRGFDRELEIWLEPGRFLVAEAGVLIARVTQTKGKGERQYVGLATGTNSLIRPALYGAYHEIFNLTRLGAHSEQVCNIVGPICETGDILGLDRLLPHCKEGDLILIANTGAYGAAMASRYNMREPAIELFME